MDNLFALLIVVSFIFLIIGIFNPSTSLFWVKQARTRKKSAIIYSSILVVSFILFGITTYTKSPTRVAGAVQTKSAQEEESQNRTQLTKEQMDSMKLAEKLADSIAQAEKAAADRKEEIAKQFSAWDGSHRNLEKFIKQNMNDPDSYEHIETTYWDMKDHLVVLTKFRGKNGFGGKVVNTVKAEVDMEGNVTNIIEQN